MNQRKFGRYLIIATLESHLLGTRLLACTRSDVGRCNSSRSASRKYATQLSENVLVLANSILKYYIRVGRKRVYLCWKSFEIIVRMYKRVNVQRWRNLYNGSKLLSIRECARRFLFYFLNFLKLREIMDRGRFRYL